MKFLRIILIVLLTLILGISVFGAYLKNVPITITQPNGTKIACLATGDEFYNWLHDSSGYTIVQSTTTGYYCYAILVGDSLVASQYVVGMVSPASVNLQPNINISGEKIREKINKSSLYMLQSENALQSGQQKRGGLSGTINNIVIYIRFADDPEFPAQQNTYTNMFNSTSSGVNSMRNYFQEATYGNLNIVSHFYPANNGTVILSYQDSKNRDYYRTNSSNRILCRDAVNYVKNQIPASLNIDYNNDGYVDNICFVIRSREGQEDPFWPHQSSLRTLPIIINGKIGGDYNLQNESFLTRNDGWYGNQTLCHEMYHTLGAPDLYHYNEDNMHSVGPWDLMDFAWNPPRHMGAYMKYKYGGWISSIPAITTSGTYTLNPLTSSTNNCYKIPIQGSSQYIVLEYRKKNGVFENRIPNSGLIIYRINEAYRGNTGGAGLSGGVRDEVYIFRPGGKINPPDSKGDVDNAHFSQTAGRTVFSNSTNPYGFTVPNGDYANVYITNIRENTNGTLSFDVWFCNNDNITYSNTNNLPTLTDAFTIQTSGTVTVKSTDNVIFQAGHEVILNSGFEIQVGGTFEINMNGCAN